jgi:hypothetical protein
MRHRRCPRQKIPIAKPRSLYRKSDPKLAKSRQRVTAATNLTKPYPPQNQPLRRMSAHKANMLQRSKPAALYLRN